MPVGVDLHTCSSSHCFALNILPLTPAWLEQFGIIWKTIFTSITNIFFWKRYTLSYEMRVVFPYFASIINPSSPYMNLAIITPIEVLHDDVIKWKHFPRYWPFVRGIHRSPVNSPHKGPWRGALMFSLNCALNKQSWGWWYETLSRSLWRHCNVHVKDPSHQ